METVPYNYVGFDTSPFLSQLCLCAVELELHHQTFSIDSSLDLNLPILRVEYLIHTWNYSFHPLFIINVTESHRKSMNRRQRLEVMGQKITIKKTQTKQKNLQQNRTCHPSKQNQEFCYVCRLTAVLGLSLIKPKVWYQKVQMRNNLVRWMVNMLCLFSVFFFVVEQCSENGKNWRTWCKKSEDFYSIMTVCLLFAQYVGEALLSPLN